MSCLETKFDSKFVGIQSVDHFTLLVELYCVHLFLLWRRIREQEAKVQVNVLLNTLKQVQQAYCDVRHAIAV